MPVGRCRVRIGSQGWEPQPGGPPDEVADPEVPNGSRRACGRHHRPVRRVARRVPPLRL